MTASVKDLDKRLSTNPKEINPKEINPKEINPKEINQKEIRLLSGSKFPCKGFHVFYSLILGTEEICRHGILGKFLQRGAQAGLLEQNGGGTSIGFTADLHIALLGIGKHLIFLGQAKIGMIAHVRG